MKRAMMLFLAAGLLLSMTSGARAADVNIKGQWQNGFSWADRNPLKSANASVDRFKASTRLRTQIDIVASDSLKGVVFFEVGHQNWGTNDAALGTDGKVVKVRYSYVDWSIPETDAKVRMGLQPFDIATFAVPYAAFMTDGAGISLSGNFTENVGATLFGVRAYNNDERTVSVYDKDNTLLYTYNSHDAMDVIGLVVPVQFDGIRMNPFGMYSAIGKDTRFGVGANNKTGVASGLLPVGTGKVVADSKDNHGNAWWGGLSAEMTLFSPLRVAVDGVYGKVDMGKTGNQDLKRAGWYAALAAECKTDFVTPGLTFWYASGDDANALDGSERMPVIDTDVALTSFGYDGGMYNRSSTFNGTDISGSWGIMAELKDISFIEALSHAFRVAMVKGTNNTEMVRGGVVARDAMATVGNNMYLTTKDKLWEVNFDSQYKLYEGLTLAFELGYIYLDADKELWNDLYKENNFQAAFSVNYKF